MSGDRRPVTNPRKAHVLVIQTAFLGDVVLTTGLLNQLAERFGPVDIVTTPAASELVFTHPAVRHTWLYDKRGADQGVAGLLRLAGSLRRNGYRSAYLPHRSFRSAVIYGRFNGKTLTPIGPLQLSVFSQAPCEPASKFST